MPDLNQAALGVGSEEMEQSKKFSPGKIFLAAALLLAALAAAAVWLWAASRVTDIGTRRQFFWDDAIVDTQKTTAPKRLHHPEAQEVVLTADSPWEGGRAGGYNLLPVEGGYRLYYLAGSPESGVRVCYAQSADGIRWEKPAAGLVLYEGSGENNILLDAGSGVESGFSVFEDPTAEGEGRYKAVAGMADGSLAGFTSADGLNWRQGGTVAAAAAAGPIALNSAFYDAEAGRYSCYFVREGALLRVTSKDFIRWSAPKAVDCQPDTEYATANLFPYYREPGVLVGFPLRAAALTDAEAEALSSSAARETLPETAQTLLSDAVFLTSRDGESFTQADGAWLTPGPQHEGNWLYGDCLTAGGLAETPALHSDDGQDNELSFYVAENTFSGTAQLRRYTTRIDGFVSRYAPYNTCRVFTKPLRFSGSRMTVNFSTSNAGYLFVRILDENGEPFSASDTDGVAAYTSYRMFGDRVEREVAFNADLSALAGKTVVLEFIMSDAELYSFRFDDEPCENTAAWQAVEPPEREYGAVSCEDGGEPLEIGTERQLFWDDYILDAEKTTAALTSHSPTRREEIFTTDLPWEGDNCDFYVILNDEDALGQPFLRMYYLGWDSSAPEDIRVCYACSYDGSHWEKPALGLHSYTDPATGRVYEETNIILYTEEAPFDNFFVTKDTREGVPESRRYLAVAQGSYDQLGYPSFGLWGWTSPDGIHWTKSHRVLPEREEWFAAFDSVNTLVWDDATQQFYTYFRVREATTLDGVEFPDVRKIYGAVSPDFEPVEESTIFPLDYGENSPFFEMYTNNIAKYYRAPQIFLGFPTRFTRKTDWEKNYEYLTDPAARRAGYEGGQITRTLSMTEPLVMTSRDGVHWNRRNEAWLTPGPEYHANWIYGNGYPAYGLVETAGEHPGQDPELSTYLFEGKFYHQPSVLWRYTFRVDGIQGYSAGYEPKTVTTRPFVFDGSALTLNLATSAAGRVEVRLLDEEGRPLPGYSAGPLVGDQIDRPVAFAQSLEALAGTPVRLEFVLSDAEVFSFKFS